MLELLNFLLAVITGWSLGYLGVYNRTYEYQRYFPILISSQFVILGLSLDVSLVPLICGLIACVVTSVFTYDPILPGGYKIFKEDSVFKSSS